jgi:uncharacterized protein YuzB (UPF0349 family)
MSIVDLNIANIANALQELSKQIQAFQETNRLENEKLTRYQNDSVTLEFSLVTGGIIKGKILWVGGQSLGIENDRNQKLILYKQAIAFIQEKVW